MLINNLPFQAAIRPFAGFGAGALLSKGSIAFGTAEGSIAFGTSQGSIAGSYTGEAQPAFALRRMQWAFCTDATGALAYGSTVAASRTQFEQHQALIDPVAPGGMGPNPVREPEPA